MNSPPRLDSPLQLRGVTLPNRIVGAPMERNYCDLLGRVTPRYVDYLARRAAGGTGLLFTESCCVTQAAKARPHQMGLHGDHAVDGLARLAAAVHAATASGRVRAYGCQRPQCRPVRCGRQPGEP